MFELIAACTIVIPVYRFVKLQGILNRVSEIHSDSISLSKAGP